MKKKMNRLHLLGMGVMQMHKTNDNEKRVAKQLLKHYHEKGNDFPLTTFIVDKS